MDTFSYPAGDGRPLRATRLGTGPTLVLLHESGSGAGHDHGGGLLPLARRLTDSYTVIVSEARDADDAAALAEHLGLGNAAVGGTGRGAVVALRAAADHPEPFGAAVVIDADEVLGAVGEGIDAPDGIDLSTVRVPTLVIPGTAGELARALPQGKLANLSPCGDEDPAQWMAPAVWAFLTTHLTRRPARVLV
ncbi:alpha/beta hydrolase [Streptomyces sp. SCSIO 30461]|uniref:alpha/beta fold hydrolase n=1 Tax=Streptomyces sp. SCSIO 30461 TaxID=3118085 RepID=UPI0030D32A4C